MPPQEQKQKPIKKYRKLRFPTRGIWKRLAYDLQPEEYCADSNNVWADDTLTSRERGGSRPGLEALGTAGSGPIRTINRMNWSDSSTSPHSYKTTLVAASAGALYYSNNSGTSWTSAGTGLYSDRPISIACHRSRVYACDTASPYLKYWEPNTSTYADATPTASNPYTQDDVTIADQSSVVTLNATGGHTWPEWAASAYIQFQDDGGTWGPIYTISTRDSNTQLTMDLTFALGSLVISSLAVVTYRLILPPAPPKCTLACNWHDSVILAGDLDNPNLFYGSRVGDGRDYQFLVPGDPSSAWASNSVPSAGAVGEQITSLIPMNDDQLFIGSTHSLSVMNGHPLNGGILQYVDQNIGPLGQNSWCVVPHESGNWLAMITKQGLYVMPPGGRPKPVSRKVIPNELVGIDPSVYETTVGYDLNFNGLILCVAPRTFGVGTPAAYFVDLDTVTGQGGEGDITGGSFWPMSFATGSQPFAQFNNPTWSKAQGYEGSLMLGGKDGKMRRFKSTAGPDDGIGEDVTSYVILGPYQMTETGYTGKLISLDVTLAGNSGTVTLQVKVGNSAEEAFNASAFDSKTWSFTIAGYNYTIRPMARGAYFCLKFAAAVNVRWSLESVLALITPAGQRRLE